MKKLCLLFFFLSYFSPVYTQVSLDEINKTRCQHNLNGMIAFSSWTATNLTVGTIGVLTTQGEWQHFFEMNIYFNLINLGIAVPGLISSIKAKRTGLSFEESVKEVQKVKTTYLVNGVLDFTYISLGFLLREIGKNNYQNIHLHNRLTGYGNSFIVQGGFLLLYDFIAFALHHNNGKRLDAHWKKISFQPSGAYGLGLRIQYKLHETSFPPLPYLF